MQWKLPPTDTYFAPILRTTPDGFELDHLAYALEHCRKFRMAVDGGAHIGTWSVALAQRFIQVYAIEPAPDTFDCLLQNTEGLGNVVRLNVALGPSFGECGVMEDPTRPGNTGSRMIDPQGQGARMIPLDCMDLPYLDFLKLDVEGYELAALKGAYQKIQSHRPTILVECKRFDPPRHGGPELVKRYLIGLGYKEVGGIRNDRVFIPKEIIH